MGKRNLSIIIPYKFVPGVREENFQFVRKYYKEKFPDAEIIIGLDNSGENNFYRSFAINKGIEQASCDNILINDADIFISPNLIRKGLKLLNDTPFVIPWGCCVDLKDNKSKEILNNGLPDNLEELFIDVFLIRDIRPESVSFLYPKCAGGIQLIKKNFFNKIGGYDTRFKNWGYEDTHFCYKIKNELGDYPLIDEGVCFHFFHEQNDGKISNKKLFEEIMKKELPKITIPRTE